MVRHQCGGGFGKIKPFQKRDNTDHKNYGVKHDDLPASANHHARPHLCKSQLAIKYSLPISIRV